MHIENIPGELLKLSSCTIQKQCIIKDRTSEAWEKQHGFIMTF
uniref:Uncharacterized protein n=1 Tax=Rhizophora mucronata TaxID=61149 RepID=A0A2P2NVY0_RHIMU